MKYLKLTNVSIDILKQEKIGGSKDFESCGMCKRQIQRLAVQYNTESNDTITYMPIKSESKFDSILAIFQEEVDQAGFGSIEVLEDNREAWLAEKEAEMTKQEDAYFLKEARKKAKIELLKNRILDPNDELS